MSSDNETDSSVENIKSWEVESSSSVEEFKSQKKMVLSLKESQF
jgi:hypothetical protein